MTEAEIETAAALLADARRRGVQIDALPVTPSSVAEGHAIQDRVAELVGESIGAFKAGVPPDGEPTRGLIEARMVRASPAHLAVAEVPHLGVEGETAFRFTRDLPARNSPDAREEIAAVVTVGLPFLQPGDRRVVRFEGLGEAEVVFDG